jgi:hypothetical protein
MTRSAVELAEIRNESLRRNVGRNLDFFGAGARRIGRRNMAAGAFGPDIAQMSRSVISGLCRANSGSFMSLEYGCWHALEDGTGSSNLRSGLPVGLGRLQPLPLCVRQNKRSRQEHEAARLNRLNVIFVQATKEPLTFTSERKDWPLNISRGPVRSVRTCRTCS